MKVSCIWRVSSIQRCPYREVPLYIIIMSLLIDLPVIPDLEAVQEEDLATQIAAPPVSVTHTHTHTLHCCSVYVYNNYYTYVILFIVYSLYISQYTTPLIRIKCPVNEGVLNSRLSLEYIFYCYITDLPSIDLPPTSNSNQIYKNTRLLSW